MVENDISISQVLGEPIRTKTERKNSVSEEELNKEGFIRAIIYDESIDRYAYIEESTSSNNQATFIWLLLTMIIYGINYAYAVSKGNDKIRNQLNLLNEKYAPLDVDSLTRKLEIRKDTYRRMK